MKRQTHQPETIEEFVEGLTPQQLRCRTRNHYMLPVSVKVLKDGRRTVGYEQLLKCKCGAKRTEVLDSRGYEVKVKYDYHDAPGYLAQGLGRMTRDSRAYMRLTSVENYLINKTPTKGA